MAPLAVPCNIILLTHVQYNIACLVEVVVTFKVIFQDDWLRKFSSLN